MQAEEYNRRGKELVDYISKYLGSIRERRVIPDVKPGYMKELLPDSAPVEPEDWENIFNDIERVIMPGASSPACTELETTVMDWLCKALGLPSFFLHHHPDSRGGGILQSTVSESTLVALLAARKDKILQLRAELDQEVDDSILNSRLVAYASDQAHSSVEKAGLISLVKIRFLPSDENLSLRGDTLKQAIQEDRRRGLVPFLVCPQLCSTLGTTGVCAFDKLSELGPVCEEEGLWLHVDAAYAGSAYFCPELRWSLQGIEFSDSFVFNPSKWMMVHFDCTYIEYQRELTNHHLNPCFFPTKVMILIFHIRNKFVTSISAICGVFRELCRRSCADYVRAEVELCIMGGAVQHRAVQHSTWLPGGDSGIAQICVNGSGNNSMHFFFFNGEITL
uniref:Histidine decarboxylase n=1 Tax=Salarias fasciatus TaxID=181472 RepID=A0A672GJW7_SALFA